MNKLSTEEKLREVSCLVEGCSLRSTVRMTGIHRMTIQKLFGCEIDYAQLVKILRDACRPHHSSCHLLEVE